MTEHERSEERTQEYVDEVTDYIKAGIDTNNTTISVEATKEEI